MAMKYKGMFPQAYNLKLNVAAPLDNRTVVSAKADLLTMEFVYKGLVVSVADEDAIYIFIGDETIEGAAAVDSNWKRLDAGSVSFTLDYGDGETEEFSGKKTLKLKSGSTVISQIDASAFIKDGMITAVRVVEGTYADGSFTEKGDPVKDTDKKYLAITWNADSQASGTSLTSYIAVDDLIHSLSGGNGISVDASNKISLRSSNKTSTDEGLSASDSIIIDYSDDGSSEFKVNEGYVKKLINDNAPTPEAGSHITITSNQETKRPIIAVNESTLIGDGIKLDGTGHAFTLDAEYIKMLSYDSGMLSMGTVDIATTTNSFTHTVADVTVTSLANGGQEVTYAPTVVDAYISLSGRKVEADVTINNASISIDSNADLNGYRVTYVYSLTRKLS